jgi:hypothetical protein
LYFCYHFSFIFCSFSYFVGLEITLVKHIPQEVEYWPSLLVGGREIDVDLIEGSKYLDRSLLKKVKASKQQQKTKGPEEEMK